MLEDDNIWKKRFSDTSLDKESWLEPDARVLGNIMRGIEKPRRYSGLVWIILLLFIGLLISGLFLQRNLNQHSEKQLEIPAGSEEPDKIPGSDKQSQSGLYAENEVIQVTSELNNDNRKFSEEENYTEPGMPVVEDKNKERSESSIPEKIREARYLTTASIDKDEPTENNDTGGEASIKDSRYIDQLDVIIRIPGKEISNADEKRAIRDPSLSPRIETVNFTPDKYLAIGLLYESWDFDLNSNYSTALNPADFHHDRGKTYGVQFAFGIPVSQYLEFRSSLSLTHTEFHSGHNSSVLYNRGDEAVNEMHNSFDLTMASPIGFLQSNIDIQRSSEEQAVLADLVLDLNNTHRLTTMHLNSEIVYPLIKQYSFEIYAELGLGFSYFAFNSNTLDNISINHASYSSIGSDIVQEPANINKFGIFGSAGFSLRYHLSDIYFISSSAKYISHQTALFSQDDFSTGLGRTAFMLQFGKKF